MAIEDAAAVANALSLVTDPGLTAVAAGLRAYEASRQLRSTAVSAFSRHTGAVQMLGGRAG